MAPWRVSGCAGLAVLLVAGCSAASRPSPDAGRLRGAQLTVLAAWTGTEQARFSRVLRVFSDRTGVTVHYVSAHGRVPSVLDARIADGTVPDVALLPQPGLLRRYAKAGRLVPLAADTEQLVQHDYAPLWRSLASYNGQDYGVWFKAANKSLVWYDIALFERTGLAPPSDLDGLGRVADVLQQQGIAAFAVAGADAWTLTDWFENLYLALAGPARYDDLTEHRLSWTDATVTRTLQEMAALLSPPHLLGGVPGALALRFEDSVARAFGRPPGAAMLAEGDFTASVVTSRTPAGLGVDVDVFPFPAGTRGRATVVAGGDVAVQLTRTPAAAALLRFLATPAAAAVWAAAGGFVSPNLDLDLSVYPTELARSIARTLTEATDGLRFDLSDLQPADFGAQPDAGLQAELRRFLVTRDIAATQRRLEAAARTAYARQGR